MVCAGELHHSDLGKLTATAFGSTATGISVHPHERSDTPRGRNSWVRGAVSLLSGRLRVVDTGCMQILGAKGGSAAPDVGLQMSMAAEGVTASSVSLVLWPDCSVLR